MQVKFKYSKNYQTFNVTRQNVQGGPKKSVFSKNENRPWWGFFEKKIHDQ